MKNNKHSLILLVLVLCTSITSVMAQDVSVSTPFKIALGNNPPTNVGEVNPRGDMLGGTYTVEAGSNRLLVAFVHGEDNTADTEIKPTSVTYGGEAMTKVVEQGWFNPTGFDTYSSMWILKEAGIQAALGDMVEVTWNTNPSSQGHVDCIVLQNVEQTNTIGYTGSAKNNGSTATMPLETGVLKTNPGDLIVAAMAGASFSGPHTWDNGFTDAIADMATRPTGGFGVALGAYKAMTNGGDEKVAISSTASQARRTLVAAVIQKLGSPALSINDNKLAANAISVYPNPASDVVNIDSVSSAEKEISVFNSLGQIVSKTKSSGNAKIDLKSLNVSGFVIVQVIADGKVSNHKVIVK